MSREPSERLRKVRGVHGHGELRILLDPPGSPRLYASGGGNVSREFIFLVGTQSIRILRVPVLLALFDFLKNVRVLGLS